MDKTSVTARYYDERLSDNTQVDYCEQCRGCAFWGSDVWSNKYDKACCDMYPYPDHKPSQVINNTGKCEFFVKRVGK